MTPQIFKECLDKIPGRVKIDFAGFCEPFLNPDCIEMYSYAYSKGHVIKIFTTLTGMKPSDVKLLERKQPKKILVHLPSSTGNEKIKIDESYLQVLDMLLRSKINMEYHSDGNEVHPEIQKLVNKEVRVCRTINRAGNLETVSGLKTGRIKGRMACSRGLKINVLLPNGDVVLCCNDFGMKHVLGNLLVSDYKHLFSGEEILRVRRGLKDDTMDILCRYCEKFGRKVILGMRFKP